MPKTCTLAFKYVYLQCRRLIHPHDRRGQPTCATNTAVRQPYKWQINRAKWRMRESNPINRCHTIIHTKCIPQTKRSPTGGRFCFLIVKLGWLQEDDGYLSYQNGYDFITIFITFLLGIENYALRSAAVMRFCFFSMYSSNARFSENREENLW